MLTEPPANMPQNQGFLIKQAIQNHLQNLVDAGTLEKFYYDDLTMDALETKYSGDPLAILGLNSDLNMERDTTTSNLNTYTYWIMVRAKLANLKNPTDVEDLRDNVMTEFAQDTTYGLANGWVDPPLCPAPPVTDQAKGDVVFLIKIIAHVASDLTTIS